jgi:LysM repeat protein
MFYCSKIKESVLIALLFITTFVDAQPFEKKISAEEYVTLYKDDAIREMLMNGVPASITLAQGMLESGNGNSALAVYARNHFGIKCHKGWIGESFIQDDDEKNECFRKYNEVLESYSDHSKFLRTRERYSFLFELPLSDYKAWAHGLKTAGYATHPTYAEQLIDLIEKFELNKYDRFEEMPVLLTAAGNVTPIPKMEIRKVQEMNSTKFIISKQGDSYFKIAGEFNLEMEQILAFNDLSQTETIRPGKKIYVERKKKKAAEEFHQVQRGETMLSISQLYGIRVKQLYKLNKMELGDQPMTGQVLHLKSKKRVHSESFAASATKY